MNEKDKKPLPPIVVKRTVQHKFSDKQISKFDAYVRIWDKSKVTIDGEMSLEELKELIKIMESQPNFQRLVTPDAVKQTTKLNYDRKRRRSYF